MCVCMAPEYAEVNGCRNLSGEERRKSCEVIKVYTRKNRKPKIRAASPSADDEPSLCSISAKNRICRGDYVVQAAQGDTLEGQDRNFTEEKLTGVGFKSTGSKIDIDKSGGSANGLPHGVTELCPTGGGVVEDLTKSHVEEDGEHIHTSSRQENCNESMIVCDDQEAGPQLDICSRQKPSYGGRVRGVLLEGQADGLEMVSNHLNERRGDEAVEPSGREEIQPSNCEALATNNKELKQSVNGRVDLEPNVGQVKSPIDATGINPCGQDIHVNHLAPNVLEIGVSKPLISRDGDSLIIALSKSNSQDELQRLKRKLEIDLDQVRRVKRKLEEKEFQVAAYNDVRNIPNGAGYIGSIVNDSNVYDQQLSTRVSSSVGVAHPETRPFRNLSVSVMENNHDFAEFVEKEKRTPKANPLYTSSEFYLEKDRLPSESHRKPKVHGAGRRHRGADYGLALGFGVDQDGDKLFKNCSNLLQRLMKYKHGWVFNSPVDPIKLGIPDYHDIIKHPMDLGTIQARLAQNQYNSAMEFAEDVRLVFYNAMTYNPKGQDVHTMAEELLTIFETRWASIENGYFQKKMYNRAVYFPARRQGYQPRPVLAPLTIPAAQISPSMKTFHRTNSMVTPNSIVTPASYSVPRVARTPAPKKPKAKDPNKRDMTNDEKQKLSTNLQSLPVEKLDAIVQIIKKRSSALSQHDDEIEVDIDSVDAETLWELDRFVSNYKKSLSKYKRKAELAQKARIEAAQAIPTTNPIPVGLDSQKESTAGGNVSAAPIQVEVPTTNSPSSSSSSSSSDSGSSSSDSDSDSSSDDSDAGHSPAA